MLWMFFYKLDIGYYIQCVVRDNLYKTHANNRIVQSLEYQTNKLDIRNRVY